MAEEKDELKKQISEDNPFYVKVNEELNSTGCGMCLAKWTQVTMHLQLGHTHSCHHPKTHPIPEREIRRNPSALHNTRYKKQKRREMLEGKRPEECNYCWNIEDSSDRFSDRTFKSAESWSYPHMDEIKQSHWRDDFNPRYVEVAFSNACNFKCSYCAPAFSTQWMEEIKKHGAYPTTDKFNDLEYNKQENKMPIPQSEENPYVEAFWKWWPDLYKDLHTFRITGGEPLLTKDTFKVLEYIQENWEQNPNLSLAINTNLSVPDKLIEKFLIIAKDLTENNKVRELIIFTSVEATGSQAEYTRFGLKYDKFWINIEKLLTDLPKLTVNIMAAFNALSVFTYGDLIDKIFEFKRRFHNKDRYWGDALQLDTSYLRWPSHLSIKILEPIHKQLIYDAAVKALYYGKNPPPDDTAGFSDIQIQKIKRTYDYAIGDSNFDVEKNRKDFASFITEYDKRRGTNFIETYPELEELYVKYKK
jgi:organic radical activating enzyme